MSVKCGSFPEYIKTEYISEKVSLFTRYKSVKKRLDRFYPDISAWVKLIDSQINKEDDAVSLDLEIVKFLQQKNTIAAKKPKYICFNDLIDEADNIIRSWQDAKKKFLIATNNPTLKLTLQARLNSFDQIEIFSQRDLWIQSAESLFFINKIDKINHFCHHELIVDSMKSSLFNKNHVVRNQIIDQFNQHSHNIKHKNKYKFLKLHKLHHDFINSVTVKPVEPLFITAVVQEIKVYEYIKLIRAYFQTKIAETELESKIEIISLEELPFISEEESVWIGGVSCENPIPLHLLKIDANIHNLSFSAFYKNSYHYPQAQLLDNFMDKRKDHVSYVYSYTSPTPPIHHRKNSFAINHITKLLNNPHNFYVENILRLKPYYFHPNHIVGIMAHSIFETIVNQVNEFDNYEAFNEKMRVLLIQNHFNKLDFINVYKKMEIMLKHVWSTIKGAEFVCAEKEGVQTIIHNNQTYLLHGRADLIYEKDGKVGLIEFKTGTPPSWVNIMNGSAPQVSICMLMLRFGGFLDKEIPELAESGFISPKGLFLVNSSIPMIQSAVNGIKSIITKFWEEESPYYIHLTDPNWPYRCIARGVKCD